MKNFVVYLFLFCSCCAFLKTWLPFFLLTGAVIAVSFAIHFSKGPWVDVLYHRHWKRIVSSSGYWPWQSSFSIKLFIYITYLVEWVAFDLIVICGGDFISYLLLFWSRFHLIQSRHCAAFARRIYISYSLTVMLQLQPQVFSTLLYRYSDWCRQTLKKEYLNIVC